MAFWNVTRWNLMWHFSWFVCSCFSTNRNHCSHCCSFVTNSMPATVLAFGCICFCQQLKTATDRVIIYFRVSSLQTIFIRLLLVQFSLEFFLFLHYIFTVVRLTFVFGWRSCIAFSHFIWAFFVVVMLLLCSVFVFLFNCWPTLLFVWVSVCSCSFIHFHAIKMCNRRSEQKKRNWAKYGHASAAYQRIRICAENCEQTHKRDTFFMRFFLYSRITFNFIFIMNILFFITCFVFFFYVCVYLSLSLCMCLRLYLPCSIFRDPFTQAVFVLSLIHTCNEIVDSAPFCCSFSPSAFLSFGNNNKKQPKIYI